MDLGSFGSIEFSWHFLSGLLSIIIIDLILAGDNAVIIALAVRSLPAAKRRRGIFLGAAAAVLLRIVATFFISQLLTVPYLKLAGGLLILWIAVKLLSDSHQDVENTKDAASIYDAIKIIVIADLTMSIDNMLAVGGASHGNFFLLLFGLGLSIPLVVFASNLLSILMDRYPIIIYIGAAVLGRVGGEMIMTDPAVIALINPSDALRYSVEAFSAVGVVVAGWLLSRGQSAGGNVPSEKTR